MEEILSQPDKLSDLDLDAFAEELERQDYGNKKITLYDIRNELFAPFKERREAYSLMTEVCTHCRNCVEYCAMLVKFNHSTDESECMYEGMISNLVCS